MSPKDVVGHAHALCNALDGGLSLGALRLRNLAIPAALPAALALSFGAAGCRGEGGPYDYETGEVVCDDAEDNDGDGAIDCADTDCSNEPPCAMMAYGMPFEEDCENDTDDDGDGLADCEDPDCTSWCGVTDYAAPFESDCINGVDDDEDELIDCEDPDCAGMCGAPAYGVPFEEDCVNGLDDDGDEYVDCEDPDCASDPGCLP